MDCNVLSVGIFNVFGYYTFLGEYLFLTFILGETNKITNYPVWNVAAEALLL